MSTKIESQEVAPLECSTTIDFKSTKEKLDIEKLTVEIEQLKSKSKKEDLELQKFLIEIEQLKSKNNDKEKLELQKLLTEVDQLKEPWWRKPNFVLALLPTLLATASIIYGVVNGYFSVYSMKLEAEKKLLEIQKTEIQTQIEKLEVNKKEIEKGIDQKTEELKKKTRQIEQMAVELMSQKDDLARARERVRQTDELPRHLRKR